MGSSEVAVTYVDILTSLLVPISEGESSRESASDKRTSFGNSNFSLVP